MYTNTNTTDDHRPVALGGTQSITTPEGFVIPLDVINCLCYMKLRPFTDQELRDLVHIEMTMTSGTEWDPTRFDSISTMTVLGCNVNLLYHPSTRDSLMTGIIFMFMSCGFN